MYSRFHKKKPYFRRLFFSIITITLVVALLLSFVLFSLYKRNVVDVVHKSNQQVLEQIKLYAQTTDHTVREYGVNLSANHMAKLLYNSESLTAHQLLTSINGISLNLKNFPPISSVYLYNGHTDMIYMIDSGATYSQLDSFFDTEIVEKIRHINDRGFSKPFYREVQQTSFSKNTEPVYSYIISDRYSSTSDNRYALVVNVNLEYIFSMLEKDTLSSTIGESYVNNIIIFNENQIIGSTSPDIFTNPDTLSAITRDILEEDQNSGSITATLEKTGYIVDYTTMEYTGWKIASIVPEKHFDSFSALLLRTTLLLVITSCLIAVVCAYLLSRQLYQPIGETLKALQNFGQADKSAACTATEEFLTIQNTLSEIQQDINTLSGEHYRSQTAAIKETIWQQVTTQKYSSMDFVTKCNEFGFKITADNWTMVALASFDRYDQHTKDISVEDLTLIRYAIENILMDVLSERYTREVFFINNKSILLLLTGTQQDFENVEKIFISAGNAVHDVFSIPISFYYAPPCKGVLTLHQQYDQAVLIGKHKIFHASGTLLMLDDVINLPNYNNASMDINVMRQYLQNGDMTCLDEWLSGVFHSFHGFSYDTVMAALTFLASLTFNTLWLIEKNSSLSFTYNYWDFNAQLMQCEYLDDSKELFRNLLQSATYQISDVHQHTQQSVGDAVKEYITNHLQDQNLSANQIASHFYLTSASLNRSFKSLYHISIQEYITQTRLKQAEDLLLNTGLTIKEIADKIGWSNAKYFYTQFKQRNGVTPTQFRTYNATKSFENKVDLDY